MYVRRYSKCWNGLTITSHKYNNAKLWLAARWISYQCTKPGNFAQSNMYKCTYLHVRQDFIKRRGINSGSCMVHICASPWICYYVSQYWQVDCPLSEISKLSYAPLTLELFLNKTLPTYNFWPCTLPYAEVIHTSPKIHTARTQLTFKRATLFRPWSVVRIPPPHTLFDVFQVHVHIYVRVSYCSRWLGHRNQQNGCPRTESPEMTCLVRTDEWHRCRKTCCGSLPIICQVYWQFQQLTYSSEPHDGNPTGLHRHLGSRRRDLRSHERVHAVNWKLSLATTGK